MATRELDPERAEAFAGHMLDVVNGGMLALMTSIGHQTGLFDTMAGLPPSASPAIAEAAGLNERYVREWLGAMVTGRIVEYDAGSGTYSLPAEHAACLTRAAGPDNLACFAQYVRLLGDVEGGIVERFRAGGGLPYAAYPDFQRLQAEETARVFDATLVDVTLPLVPGLVERLAAGIDVADFGCGAGHAVNLMAKAFPRSRFVGYDFSAEGVAAGTAEAAELGLGNTRFAEQDLTIFDQPASFDFVTAFDTIHDQGQPAKVLRAAAEALRSGGTFLMVDVAASSKLEENLEHPLGPALYTVSCMHCMTVSLAQGGAGLGAMWGEQKARELLAEAGFVRVGVKQVEGDILNSYYICAKE